MYQRRRAATALLALTAVVALSACSESDNGNNTLAGRSTSPTPQGGPQSTAPATTPTGEPAAGPIKELDAKDNEFVPKAFSAKAGTISFTVKNTGAAPHTFTVADLKVDVNVNAGQSAPVEIKDAKPGTYHFVCKYHESLGMVGDLTVT